MSQCPATCRDTGRWFKCALPLGHGGKHTWSITWGDAD